MFIFFSKGAERGESLGLCHSPHITLTPAPPHTHQTLNTPNKHCSPELAHTHHLLHLLVCYSSSVPHLTSSPSTSLRLWTVSHSSEHIEGVPPIPSRLNPSQFAASPNTSPSRNLPHDHVHAQAPLPRQDPTPRGEPIPNIAGYSREGLDHPHRHGENPHSWNGQHSTESPFMDGPSSLGGWVYTSQHQGSPTSSQGFAQSGQGLSRLGQNRLPSHQLELNPEASEQYSPERNYSDTPRLSGHMAPHGSGPYSSHLQPHTDHQTNGSAPDWHHQANMAKTFQHI